MHKPILPFMFMLLLTIVYSKPIECKQDTYVPALNIIAKTVDLLQKSSVTQKELEELKTVKVTKKNYKKDMEVLRHKIILLEGKKKDASEANTLNEKNLQTWVALEKSCKGDEKLAATKVKNDVIDLQKTLKQRLSTINYYINLTNMGISVGKKRYRPNAK